MAEEFLLSFCDENKLLKKGMVLASPFIKWRSLNPVSDCDFSQGFCIAILLYLQHKNSLDNSMNEIQIFKQVLLYIEQTCFENLFSEIEKVYQFESLPIFIKKDHDDNMDRIEIIPKYKIKENGNKSHSSIPSSQSDAIIDDSKNSFNMTTSFDTVIFSRFQYKMLQIDSRNIIKIINETLHLLPKIFNGSSEAWDLKYDFVISFPLASLDNVSGHSFHSSPSLLDTIESIYEVLERGLSNRVEAMSFKIVNQSVNIGFLLIKEHAFNVLELGPTVQNHQDCIEFDALWQGKWEIRKFADLSIRHVVSWEYFFSKRHLIVPEMISHLLRIHFNIDSSSHKVDFFDLALKQDQSELFSVYHKAFNSLTKLLYSVKNIPLSIVSIEACNPVHSFSHYPERIKNDSINGKFITDSLSLSINSSNVIIWFEGSSKWPNDLKMIETSKQAFYLQIYRQLKMIQNKKDMHSQHDSNNQSFHRNHSNSSHLHSQNLFFSSLPDFKLQLCKEWLDICIDGFIFRCLIGCSKEFDLLQHRQNISHLPKSDSGLDPALEWNKEFIIKPRLTRALHALHLDSILFGVVARMCKFWLSCQWMEGVIPEDSLDIIIATIFLDPKQRTRPLSRVSSFLRFLEIMASLSMHSNLCPLEIYAKFDGHESKEGSTNKKEIKNDSSEKNENHYIMNIRTNISDRDDLEIWSLKDSLQLKELASLAKAALTLSLSPNNLVDPEILFRRSLKKSFDNHLQLVSEKRILGKLDREQKKFLFAGRYLVNFSLISLVMHDLSKKFSSNQAIFYRGIENDKIMIKIIKKDETDQILQRIKKACSKDLLVLA